MDVTQKELAKILGITARRVRMLNQEEGLFAKEGEKRKYTLEKCVQEYISFKVNGEATKTSAAGRNKEREQAEHEAIKKEISKLKLRRLKGQLHEAADVERFVTDMLIAFRNKLMELPQTTAPLIVGEKDVNVIIGLLEKKVLDALTELMEYDPLEIDKDFEEDLFEEEEEEDEY